MAKEPTQQSNPDNQKTYNQHFLFSRSSSSRFQDIIFPEPRDKSP